jgi:hypothetical protein
MSSLSSCLYPCQYAYSNQTCMNMFEVSTAYYIRRPSLSILKSNSLFRDKCVISKRMDTPTLVYSQDVDALLSDLPDYMSDELMQMLCSPQPPSGPPPPASPQPPPPPLPQRTTTAQPVVSRSFMELLRSTSTKVTVQKKKRTAWNKGHRKGNASPTIPRAARRGSPRRRCTLSNVAPPIPAPPPTLVVELPPITVIEEDSIEPPPIATMTTMSMHAEVMSAPTTNARTELAEAQRLSDATVQEWFARRVAPGASPTLIEEVDRRLAMMLARKKLGESQQALAKVCVADAVAHAIFAYAI